MLDTLIQNVTAVTMDDPRPVIQDAFVGVKGGVIAYTGTNPPKELAKDTIDGDGAILMPGFVNTHAHVAMTLLRGFADDYKLQPWLFEKVFPAEAKIDKRMALAGVKLGFAEMLRNGVTSVTDMYYHIPAEAEFALECGIRLNVTNSMLVLDPENWSPDRDRAFSEVNEVLSSFHGKDNGRIRVDAGIHAEYTSKPEMWSHMVRIAEKNGLALQIHMSETLDEHNGSIARHGKTPAEILDEYGVFDVPTVAAHCVHVTDRDMDIMAKKGVTAAHCPVSNLKLGSGIANVREMLKRGVNVSLGTDGMCSNNSHDMFEELKLAALLQKGVSGEPDSLPAREALKMATVAGAKAQMREGEIGVIREGAFADLILVSTKGLSMFPMYDPESALAYCANGSDVVMTMVQGRILWQNGSFSTIDVESAKREIEEYALPILLGGTVK